MGQNGPPDLSGLFGLFQGEGLRVKTSKGEITDRVLAGEVDALVISGAFLPVTPPEIAAIQRFLGKGERMGIMLCIGHPVADLLHGQYFKNHFKHEE